MFFSVRTPKLVYSDHSIICSRGILHVTLYWTKIYYRCSEFWVYPMLSSHLAVLSKPPKGAASETSSCPNQRASAQQPHSNRCAIPLVWLIPSQCVLKVMICWHQQDHIICKKQTGDVPIPDNFIILAALYPDPVHTVVSSRWSREIDVNMNVNSSCE